MRDLFEVCQGLEALAGELACERITDAEIIDVAAAHAAMVRHYGDRDLLQYYRCNRYIHEAIIAAAGNPVLTGLIIPFTARIRRARYVTPMMPQRWALAVQEHEAILNALQRRDGVGLSHILRAHLRHKRDEVMQAGFAETERQDQARASSRVRLDAPIGIRSPRPFLLTNSTVDASTPTAPGFCGVVFSKR